MTIDLAKIDRLEIASRHKAALIDFCSRIIAIENGIMGIVLIGSASRAGEFNEEESDLDICIYSDKVLQSKDSSRYSDTLLGKFVTSFVMPARQIDDYMGKRIETCIIHNNITIDITWLPKSLPKPGVSFYDIPQDCLELHIGSLYLHGKVLFGVLPDKSKVDTEFFPYYSDSLRRKRMAILDSLISNELRLLEIKISAKDPDVLSYTVQLRRFFLQWLFIKEKIYITSYEKNLSHQLKAISALSSVKNAPRKILCLEGDNIFQISQNFLDVVKSFYG